MPKPDFFKKEPTTKASQKHERSVAKRSGGRLVPGSGNKPGLPGDVGGRTYHRECKTTSKAGFVVSNVILTKVCKEAIAVDRVPLLEIELRGVKPPVPTQWVLIPAEVFEDFTGRAGE